MAAFEDPAWMVSSSRKYAAGARIDDHLLANGPDAIRATKVHALAYAWGDVFLLPTLEDGFPVVVPQALAGALPVLTTPHSGAADLIEDGRNGWVLPIRRADLFLERLRWCDAHREDLAEMVRAAHRTGVAWDWAQTALQTEQAMIRALEGKTGKMGQRYAV